MSNIEEMEKGIAAIHNMAAERDKLWQENQNMKVEIADLRARLDTFNHIWEEMKTKVRELQSERDYRERQVAEILSHMNSAAAIMNDAISKASQGVFRPNGGINLSGPKTPVDQIPAFLRKVEEEIEEARKGL